MSNEYLTIKEYADIKGVSYHAIYKRLNKNLLPYVEVVNGHKMLKKEVLQDENLTSNFNVKVKENLTPSKNFNPSASADEEEIKRINRRNEDIIDELRAQVKEKDAQIQKQNDQIVELSNRITELFENNQKLQLNYQYLLGDIKEKEVAEVDAEIDAEGARAKDEPEPTPEEEPKKKGFFARLFNF